MTLATDAGTAPLLDQGFALESGAAAAVRLGELAEAAASGSG